ncbi:MAG: hypothetical protein AAF296_09485 [Pseudomonadota bacterium]
MLDALQNFGQSGAVVLLSLATGAGWVAAIIAPNCFYDGLDAAPADRQVRNLLKAVSGPTAFLLLVAGALAFLGGAIGAGICAFVAAFGFFSNSWTLRGFKRGEAPPGAKRRRKSQRVVAVAFTLLFTLVAAIGAGLAVFGV